MYLRGFLTGHSLGAVKSLLLGRAAPETARWLRKPLQKSSVKHTRLAPLQVKLPHAGSWQITAALQTPALAASDQIPTNLPYSCCVCDLLGAPQVLLAKECKQPWPEQCCPVGEAEGGLIRAHLYLLQMIRPNRSRFLSLNCDVLGSGAQFQST